MLQCVCIVAVCLSLSVMFSLFLCFYLISSNETSNGMGCLMIARVRFPVDIRVHEKVCKGL